MSYCSIQEAWGSEFGHKMKRGGGRKKGRKKNRKTQSLSLTENFTNYSPPRQPPPSNQPQQPHTPEIVPRPVDPYQPAVDHEDEVNQNRYRYSFQRSTPADRLKTAEPRQTAVEVNPKPFEDSDDEEYQSFSSYSDGNGGGNTSSPNAATSEYVQSSSNLNPSSDESYGYSVFNSDSIPNSNYQDNDYEDEDESHENRNQGLEPGFQHNLSFLLDKVDNLLQKFDQKIENQTATRENFSDDSSSVIDLILFIALGILLIFLLDTFFRLGKYSSHQTPPTGYFPTAQNNVYRQ